MNNHTFIDQYTKVEWAGFLPSQQKQAKENSVLTGEPSKTKVTWLWNKLLSSLIISIYACLLTYSCEFYHGFQILDKIISLNT